MQYQVFVRSRSESHFVASVVGMPNLTVEGRTEEEAIANAKASLKSQLATGKFVTYESQNLTSADTHLLPSQNPHLILQVQSAQQAVYQETLQSVEVSLP